MYKPGDLMLRRRQKGRRILPESHAVLTRVGERGEFAYGLRYNVSVIGGPSELRALIADAQAALDELDTFEAAMDSAGDEPPEFGKTKGAGLTHEQLRGMFHVEHPEASAAPAVTVVKRRKP